MSTEPSGTPQPGAPSSEHPRDCVEKARQGHFGFLESRDAVEKTLRTLVDHTTDAFFLHDAVGTILDVNTQACESLGYTRDELIGMNPGTSTPTPPAPSSRRLLPGWKPAR